MERKEYQYKLTPYKAAFSLLVALHFFGFIGMQLDVINDFLQQLTPFRNVASLTPFNLTLTLAILVYFHQKWDKNALLFCGISFVVGFGVEWLGVHTQLIFGSYWYGASLGWKIDQIPILIGVNWLILSYCVGVLSHRLPYANAIKALIGASIMVGLDILIEPVAIYYDFWQWEDNIIPISNYICWFIVAYLLCLTFHKLSFQKKNPMALPILIAQFLFFFAHYIVLKV